MKLDSFPYKTSCSTVDKISGTGIFYQPVLFGSRQSYQTPEVSVIRMLLFAASWQSQYLSVKKTKKNKKKTPLKMVLDQTQLRSKSPLIRLMYA